VNAHVTSGGFRIIPPSFVRVPGETDPDVAFGFAIRAEQGLEDSALHRKGGFELEARLDRTGHRHANGAATIKPTTGELQIVVGPLLGRNTRGRAIPEEALVHKYLDDGGAEARV